MIRKPKTETIVNRYMDGVLSGKIVTGKLVQQCVQRHIDDLEHGESRGLYFDPHWAEHVIEFIKCLKHTSGEYAGEQFIPRPLDAAL